MPPRRFLFFGSKEEALGLYGRAASCFEAEEKTECYEYAALLNNRAATLYEAWDYINSDNQPKDGNYAYILRKCAPSLDYFKRPEEAQACRDVAKEIYYDHRE